MEVHAHSHTARKKWTHYFWEFLMLFLAVFCGFLAEYQLEHKIEKDREKVYIKSMIEDAKTDTANIHTAITLNMKRLYRLDSLEIKCFNYGVPGNNDAEIYRLIPPLSAPSGFCEPCRKNNDTIKKCRWYEADTQKNCSRQYFAI